MKVGIATDDGGFALKEELLAKLQSAGHEITDSGHTVSIPTTTIRTSSFSSPKQLLLATSNGASPSAAAGLAHRCAPTR